MDDPYHYRHKVQAAFSCNKRGHIVAGVYEKHSHDIVDVEECQIEDAQADAIIREIKNMMRSFRIRAYDEDTGYGLLRHVLVRKGYHSGQIMVVLVLVSPILPSKNNFVKALRKKFPEISTVVINVNDRKTSMVLGERNITVYGKGFIEDELCGCTFRISPTSFYQVNPQQTEKLYRKAISCAKLTGKETVIDAYCGTGTIGLIARSRAKHVLFDFQTVFIGTGEEHDIIALHPAVTSDGVASNRCIAMSDMRIAGRVINRGCDVIWFCCQWKSLLIC